MIALAKKITGKPLYRKSNRLLLSRLLSLFLLLSLCLSLSLNSRLLLAQNKIYKLETALIYKLSKFVSWPENNTQSIENFGLCVLGNKDLVDALAILKSRKIHNLSIQIHHLDFSTEVHDQCRVLFIDPSRKAHLAIIFKQIANKSILTLSSLPGFAQSGGIIEFSLFTQPIQFTINNHKAKKYHLSINSALLNMSKLISE